MGSHSTTTSRKQATLRAATPDDAEAVATIWHAGWRDGHLGHVPPALIAHRTLDEFRRRAPARVPETTVAVDEHGAVAGNARARRFYKREGWTDTGPIDYPAEVPDGMLAVPSLRYVKTLTTE